MVDPPPREFAKRNKGMMHALDGGLWLHRHVLGGEPMAHLVSSNRALLLRIGPKLGMRSQWLQHKPLKDPRTALRVDAWHWDLRGRSLAAGLRLAGPKVNSGTAREVS